MVFSSTIFLFGFLPAVLAAYFALHPRLRNAWLLVASLVFYAWGEKFLTVILLVSIVANWALALWVARRRLRGQGRGALALAVALNVGILIVFKYADWIWTILSGALHAAGLTAHAFRPLSSFIDPGSPWSVLLVGPDGRIRLPIGVSFFTFQATSYVIDVYRGDVEPESNLVHFGMYKAFFPQLIAGPIVRYRDVHGQIRDRKVTRESFALGIRRFALGLGKKVLVANAVARAADEIFAIPSGELTPAVAWLGIACYTIQIYFDFSGYSDMAIGLGHLFGFRFLENFEHPYIARSITEFWRRWHISLSTWFRDYLYIPLGGNRVSPARTYLNLFVVFLLCGLWHGAATVFLVWGALHGAFLVVERLGLGKWLERWPSPLRHAYVMLAVMVGWVFFRAPYLGAAFEYLRAMAGLSRGDPRKWHLDLWLDPALALAILAGVLGSTPWLARCIRWHSGLERRGRPGWHAALEVASVLAVVLVLAGSILELSSGAYNPFIYFRF